MNKKRNFAKMALLSALLCGLASPTFVGCKDYPCFFHTSDYKSYGFGSTADSHYLLKIQTDFLRSRILPHKIPSVSVHPVQSGPPSPVSADG